MKTAIIGSRVEFIRGGVRHQGMVFDRRPDEATPLYVVTLGQPDVFRLCDGEVIVVAKRFVADA